MNRAGPCSSREELALLLILQRLETKCGLENNEQSECIRAGVQRGHLGVPPGDLCVTRVSWEGDTVAWRRAVPESLSMPSWAVRGDGEVPGQGPVNPGGPAVGRRGQGSGSREDSPQ